MIPRDTALETHNNQFSNRGSGSSTALSNHSSEFSIKFSSSTFMNGSTAIDESHLWKVTLHIAYKDMSPHHRDTQQRFSLN